MSTEPNYAEIEKIRAFYDYDCVWNEWADPEQFARAEPDGLGWIVGIKMKTEEGLQFVKNELTGSDEAITTIIKMRAEMNLQTTLAGGWEVDAIARRKEIVILQAENKRLRDALKKEELVNRHVAVCFHNLRARHGNDESKKLFRDELGYGKDEYSIDETCGFGLKTLAEAGNKNAQTGKAEYFEHPALKK